MKKVVLSLGLVLSLAVNTQANVYVNWFSSSGFYDLAGSGGLLGSGDSSALVQLIWSADTVADRATMTDPNYVSGDDVWLASYTATLAADTEWATFTAPVYNDNGAMPAGGYIYGRIFQNSVVEANDFYYWGPVVAANNLNPAASPPDTPQDLNMTRDSYLGFGDALHTGPYSETVQPVPEPGTMALFALGLATLGASRRRRKVQA